jgi:hypothetical protein
MGMKYCAEQFQQDGFDRKQRTTMERLVYTAPAPL